MSKVIKKVIKAKTINRHALEKDWSEDYIPELGEIVFYDPEIDENGNPDPSKLPDGEEREPITYSRQKVGDGISKIKDLPLSGVTDVNYQLATEAVEDGAKINLTRSINGKEDDTEQSVGFIGANATTITRDEEANIIISSENTKVTSVGNHYIPADGSTLIPTNTSQGNASLGVTNVITDVNFIKDAAGHIVSASTKSAKLPYISGTGEAVPNAGVDYGLVKSGGDVTIQNGIISVNGNTKSSESSLKEIIIGSSNYAQTSVVNDDSFTNVDIKSVTMSGLPTIYDATVKSYDDTGMDWAFESDSLWGDWQTASPPPTYRPYTVSYSKLIPGYISGEVDFSITGFEVHYSKSGVPSQYFGPIVLDPYWSCELVDGTWFSVTQNSNGLEFGWYHEYPNVSYDFSVWFFYEFEITNCTMDLPSQACVSLSHTDASLVAIFKPDKRRDKLEFIDFAEVVVKADCQFDIGGHINSNHKYPYFSNVAVGKIMPVVGNEIVPEKNKTYYLGTAYNQWKAVYATSFVGTAYWAKNDEKGNNIVNTYAEKAVMAELRSEFESTRLQINGYTWRLNETIAPYIGTSFDRKYDFDFVAGGECFTGIHVVCINNTGGAKQTLNVYYVSDSQSSTEVEVYVYIKDNYQITSSWRKDDTYRTLITSKKSPGITQFASLIEGEAGLLTKSQTLAGATNELFGAVRNVQNQNALIFGYRDENGKWYQDQGHTEPINNSTIAGQLLSLCGLDLDRGRLWIENTEYCLINLDEDLKKNLLVQWLSKALQFGDYALDTVEDILNKVIQLFLQTDPVQQSYKAVVDTINSVKVDENVITWLHTNIDDFLWTVVGKDDKLETNDKTVGGAINELNSKVNSSSINVSSISDINSGGIRINGMVTFDDGFGSTVTVKKMVNAIKQLGGGTYLQ